MCAWQQGLEEDLSYCLAITGAKEVGEGCCLSGECCQEEDGDDNVADEDYAGE